MHSARNKTGQFYPAVAVRVCVLRRCKVCGFDLWQRETFVATHGEQKGDLMHWTEARQVCGPVAAAPNPQYRQA